MSEEIIQVPPSQPENTEQTHPSEKEVGFLEVIARVEAVVKKLREFVELRKKLLSVLDEYQLSALEKIVEQIPSPDEGGYADDISTVDEEVAATQDASFDGTKQFQVAGTLHESIVRLQTFAEFVIHQGKLRELEMTLTEAIATSANATALMDILDTANNRVQLAESKLERMVEILSFQPDNADALKGKQEANESRLSTIQQYRELALGYASRLSEELKQEVMEAFRDWLEDPLKTTKIYNLIDKIRDKTTDNFNILRSRKEITAVVQGLPMLGEIAELVENLAHLSEKPDDKKE